MTPLDWASIAASFVLALVSAAGIADMPDEVDE